MKLLSRSTLILFIVTASAFQCAALDYTAGPGLGIAIPDNIYNGTEPTMASVNIVVPDAATIADLNVEIGMSHTWVGDLVIKLKSPAGTVVTLVSRPGSAETADDGNDTAGFGEDSNLVITSPLTYDESASASAEDIGRTPANLGTNQVVCQDNAVCNYVPNNGAALPGDLASFNGENTAGTWILYIGDGGVGDTGTIDGVTLAFANAAITECTPPPSGMVAWWPGDVGAQDIAGIHNGTFNGNAGFSAGKVGNGFTFDGTDDYVSAGDVDLPVTFTIDAWINPTSISNSPMIVAKDDGASGRSYYFQVNSLGRMTGNVINASSQVTQYDSAIGPVTTGSWQHVAMTYDGNAAAGARIKFYHNGVEISATTGDDNGGAPAQTTTPVTIGIFGSLSNSNALAGSIDELELFNRVLSGSEIQSIYAADSFGKCKQTIYVSNLGNDTIERFDASGSPSLFTGTNVSTPLGIAFDGDGNLFVANQSISAIEKFDSNGNGTLFADSTDGLGQPTALAFDRAGNLYVTDLDFNTIWKFDPAGVVSTFASTGLNQPYGLAFDGAGNLYASNYTDSTIWKFDSAGNPTLFSTLTTGNNPIGIAFDQAGNLFAAAYGDNLVYKIDSNGVATTFADSTDGVALPWGLAFDRFGSLYVVNQSNQILKFDTTTGDHTQFAGPSGLSSPADIAIQPPALPTPAPTPVVRRFVNISSRAAVGTGDNVAIAGFIPTSGEPTGPRPNGPGPVHPKRVIIRGLGPSLNVLGTPVVGRLTDPVLELHASDGSLITSNDNWRSDQETEIEATGFAPTDDNEAAIVTTLESDLVYTAILRGAGGSTGIGLVEVFDLEPLSETVLTNISTRGQVLTGDDVLIGGIIVRGDDARQIIFRALGPSLADFGVTGALADPRLEIHNAQGTLIDQNDNWRSDQEADIQATNLAPDYDAEAAVLYPTGLAPGNYTAIVFGVGGTGVGMVEAFRLGPPPSP